MRSEDLSMNNLSDLLRIFEAKSFSVTIDPSISFESAVEPYEDFSATLLTHSHNWRVEKGDEYVIKVHLLNLGVMRNYKELHEAGKRISEQVSLRNPSLREVLAFDRQNPLIQQNSIVLAHGLCALGFCGEKSFMFSCLDSRGPMVVGWYEATRFGLSLNSRFLVVETSDLEQGEKNFTSLIEALPEYYRPSE